MEKIIFGCLLLALGLWGCDDDGGRRALPTPTPTLTPIPTPTPTPTPSPTPECIPNEELIDSECLAEDILNLCEPLECMTEENISPEDPMTFILPTEQGCETVDCDVLFCNSDFWSLGDLSINEDGTLEGILIIGIDRFGGPFVCIIE